MHLYASNIGDLESFEKIPLEQKYSLQRIRPLKPFEFHKKYFFLSSQLKMLGGLF